MEVRCRRCGRHRIEIVPRCHQLIRCAHWTGMSAPRTSLFGRSFLNPRSSFGTETKYQISRCLVVSLPLLMGMLVGNAFNRHLFHF